MFLFLSNYFDLVTMIEVIEYLYDPDHYIIEVKSIEERSYFYA